MVDYPSPGIKKAAIAAIGQFCCSLAKVTQSAQSEEGLAGKVHRWDLEAFGIPFEKLAHLIGVLLSAL